MASEPRHVRSFHRRQHQLVLFDAGGRPWLAASSTTERLQCSVGDQALPNVRRSFSLSRVLFGVMGWLGKFLKAS